MKHKQNNLIKHIGENNIHISYSNLNKKNILMFDNCHNCTVDISVPINRLIMIDCSNIVLQSVNLFSGTEIIYCKNLEILIYKSPIIQIDKSRKIKLILKPTNKIYIVYYQLLESYCTTLTNSKWTKFELWEDFFSRQIGTIIDPNNLDFKTIPLTN